MPINHEGLSRRIRAPVYRARAYGTPSAHPATARRVPSIDAMGRSRRAASLERAALALIFVGGAAVRVVRPEWGRVQYDEADAASLVAAWQLDGHLPIAGTVGSTGLANPAGWPYALAIGPKIAPHPYALLAVGVVTGVLTLVLCWWVARRWFGPWSALAAAAFYAGGFFPVFLARTAWQLAFLPPLTLLCVDALLTLAILKRPWALVVACGWLGLMFQFHYVTAIHALMLPLAMWPARKVLKPGHLVSSS